MKVEEIMVRKVESVGADAMVFDAIEKMVDKRLRSLVVLPKDEKDVHGVVTVRDIVFKVLSKNLDPHKIRVEEISSKPVVCISATLDTDHAISMMKNFNIARLFVCDGTAIIGVLSLMDIMSGVLIQRARGQKSV